MDVDDAMQLLRTLKEDEDGDDLLELHSDFDSDSDEADGNEEEDEEEEAEPVLPDQRRLHLYQRAVHNIDSAVDPSSYDMWEIPAAEEQLKVVTQKKTRNDPEESITWTNKPPSQTGRQNRANILAGDPGVNRVFKMLKKLGSHSSLTKWWT